MSKFKTISTTAIAILITTSAWAEDEHDSQNLSGTPMARDENGNLVMTDTQLMEKPMGGGDEMDMPIMDMMHLVMHRLDAIEHDLGIGHESPGLYDDMTDDIAMDSQVIQMSIAHVLELEQRLQTIESLLSEIMASKRS